MMGTRLKDRAALVTGAGQGVGRGIALALAGEGAAVMLAGRTEAKLVAVADEIAARGGSARVVTGDVGVRSDIDAMVAACRTAFGRLDVLVNNAQSSVQRPLAETTEADLELAYRSGPLATFHAMLAALPLLRVDGGSVVNLGSSTAIGGDVGFASYAMAKEAIRGLTRVAAREWGRYGIRVNTICPAASSPAAEEYLNARPERLAQLASEFPLGRMGRPEEDIGRAVVALAGDDMAYLTGATLMLDGGRTFIA